jgi:hypothetical protein
MVLEGEGKGNMTLPHMVGSMGWSHMWVLTMCVVEYESWSQSTHYQHVMFLVCLDQRARDEEHLEGHYISTQIGSR